jgi:predicted dienelactone hydrolase
MPAAKNLISMLFLVRVWHRTDADGTRQFRASVSPAGAGPAHFFERPADVARFLDEADRTDIDQTT